MVGHGPAKLGEQSRSVLANRLARKVLGWEPKVSLEEGLEITYKWIEQQVKEKRLVR